MSTVVMGTGTWGTAAAVMLHRAAPGGATLLGRDPRKVDELARGRIHPQLPLLALPGDLPMSADPACLAHADLVLWAVPTQHSREQARRLARHLAPATPVVSLAKGFEEGSLKRVTQVLGEELGPRPLAALTGPSHAPEVVAGLPVALVAAGDAEACRLLVERLHGRSCRIYSSPDLIGAEVAGALKNVVAVAAGICDGLQLGDNAKAAMITRGLAEMRRLGRVLGAQDGTFAGLAGTGDLLTTCYSPHGRNRALGLAIATNAHPLDYLRRQSTVAEGAWTSRAAVALGRQLQVDLPIAAQVASILWDGTPVRSAMESLLARSPKEEDA